MWDEKWKKEQMDVGSFVPVENVEKGKELTGISLGRPNVHVSGNYLKHGHYSLKTR